MTAAAMFGDREQLARARKVALLFALVPRPATRAEAKALAEVLASWPQADRDCFAASAGVKSPSERTWDIVVEAVREQPLPLETMGDAHARGLVLLRVLQGGLSTSKTASGCEGCGVSMDAPFELGPGEVEWCRSRSSKYRNAMAFEAGAKSRGTT